MSRSGRSIKGTGGRDNSGMGVLERGDGFLHYLKELLEEPSRDEEDDQGSDLAPFLFGDRVEG